MEEEYTKPKPRKGLIVFIVLLLLAFTNPTEEDYSNWVVGRADGALETFGTELLGKPLIKGIRLEIIYGSSPYLLTAHSV